MDALVGAARAELGMRRLDAEMTAIRAAQTEVRRWFRDELAVQQRASCGQGAIGHDGPEVLQDPLVTDDMFERQMVATNGAGGAG